jgi:hypothetical protein
VTRARIRKMSSKIHEGTLGGRSTFVVRKLTPAEYAAELAAEAADDVVGLTADQSELRNRAITGEPSKATASTSDRLADVMKRLSSGQGMKKPDVQVSERKVTVPQAEPEPSYTSESAAFALSSALRKAREKKDQELRS